jgi:type I restriction-modification system DNA methylase subunit
VVDYILVRTLGKLFDSVHHRNIRVLDPACGAGSFLIAAHRLLAMHRDRENRDSSNPSVHLYGIDLDPQAAQIANVTLHLADAFHGRPHRPGSHTIACGNSLIGTDFKPDSASIASLRLFDWQEAFPDVPSEEGFDVVVGNPPWVSYGIRGTGTMDTALAAYYRSRYPHSAEYKIPIYPLFLEKAIRMLRNGGYCGFVLPDSFLLGKYFSKIRRYILDTTAIQEIIFFEEDFWPAGHSGRTVAIV